MSNVSVFEKNIKEFITKHRFKLLFLLLLLFLHDVSFIPVISNMIPLETILTHATQFALLYQVKIVTILICVALTSMIICLSYMGRVIYFVKENAIFFAIGLVGLGLILKYLPVVISLI